MIDTNEKSLFSIELVVCPKCDIDDLELTIEYYDGSKLLLTSTKYFGNVKEGQQYTKTISLTDFSFSQLMNMDKSLVSVSSGTVSIFK